MSGLHTLYVIYGRDAEGKFTIDLSSKFTPSLYTVDDVKEVNSGSRIWVEEHGPYKGYYVSTSEYQLGRYKDPNWRSREKGRFERGQYERLPWDLEPISDHFAHLSIEDGAMVAFTPDEAKGMVDIQTRMKPGRYLAKFYPHLSNDEVRELACQLDKAFAVRFAKTAEEFEHVYTNGPNSCMSHDADEYDSSIHPVRVYAAGDLQLAYLSSVDPEKEHFRASARALVWPEKKLYGRIYGDEIRLSNALEAMGYQRGSLQGARVLKVEEEEERNTYVLPYVDGPCCGVDHDGKFFVLSEHPDITARETNGLALEGSWCPYLDRRVNEDADDFYYIEDRGESWSSEAVENQNAAWLCDWSNNYYSNDIDQYEVVIRWTLSGRPVYRTWSPAAIEEEAFLCLETNKWLHRDLGVELEDTGEMVCARWAKANAWLDPSTGGYLSEKPEDAEEGSSYSDHPDQLAMAV